MKSSKKIAISSMAAALGVALLFLGGLLGVLDISAACIVSFLLLFISLEIGQLYALLTYAVISLLGFILCGNNLFAPFCFTFFFGPMVVTKFLFEKTGKIFGWILKLLLPLGLLAGAWAFGGAILELPENKWLRFAYFAAFMMIALLTQMLYTSMIRQYFYRWREKIMKYLK